jgi:hypothetical protein
MLLLYLEKSRRDNIPKAATLRKEWRRSYIFNALNPPRSMRAASFHNIQKELTAVSLERSLHNIPASQRRQHMLAEGVGFEPTVSCPTAVFKTAAFNHSTTPPAMQGERATVFIINNAYAAIPRRAGPVSEYI